MKIALIGAKGYVGSCILNEALERGHEVTGISRNMNPVPDQSGLNKVSHDILSDAVATAQLLSGHDAIINAFNPMRQSLAADIFEQHVAGHKAVLMAANLSDTSRFLAVGGAASLLLDTGEEFLESDQFPTQFEEFKPGIRGTRALYYLLKEESELDWVFLAPSAALVPGERTGDYRIGKDHLLVNSEGESSISLQDYAKAMIDEMEDPQHHQTRFTVGY
jgi:uncharacterized protein